MLSNLPLTSSIIQYLIRKKTLENDKPLFEENMLPLKHMYNIMWFGGNRNNTSNNCIYEVYMKYVYVTGSTIASKL